MEAFTSCKELWKPKTFNKFSFTFNVVWIVIGIVLFGVFQDVEINESRFDFRCDVNSAMVDKDFIRGKCLVLYEKVYNKLSVPLYGFVIVVFFLPLIVCVIYSQSVKSRIHQLETRNTVVEEAQQVNARPQRKLFAFYVCQLAIRLCLGIVFIVVLLTEVFYPREFPSDFKCNLMREVNQTANSTGNTQTPIYECNSQRAYKKTFWVYAVSGASGLLAMAPLIEILFILSRARKGTKFMDDLQFYTDHLKTNNYSPEALRLQQSQWELSVQLQTSIRWMKEKVTKNTEQLKDLFSPYRPNPGEGNKPKDLKLDQIFTNLIIYPGRAYYDFPINRREQLKVYPKPEKNLRPTRPGDIVDVQHKNILIVGRPGIGKTLFCTKFMRDWASERLFDEAHTQLRYDVAFLFKFKRLNSTADLNLRELLDLSEFSSTVDDELWNYILENPNKVLFIFDGIDEFSARENINKDDSRNAQANIAEKMPLYALYKKIASGKLLEGATVLTTTRPTAVSCLRDLEFSRVAEILGFSSQQVENYVGKFTDDDRGAKETVWQHISNNVNLFSLCYIPVNCFIICSCLLHILKNLPANSSHALASLPTKLTHIYSFAIKLFFFRHSDRYRNETVSQDEFFKPFDNLARQVQEDFKKLGSIAFKGIEEGRLTFESDEVGKLEDCGLLHRLPDLNIMAERPDRGPKAQYCFLHLTMQEFLAAKHITDTMNKEELRKFVSRHIEDGQWEVVLQFVAGLLSDRDEQLTDIFINLLPMSTDKSGMVTCWPSKKDKHLAMSLCHCLYEIDARDSAVQKKIREIGFNALVLRSCKLGPADCTSIVNFVKMHDEILMIDLKDNNIGSLGCKEICKLLTRGDSGSNCKLNSLNLIENDISDEGVKCLAEALTDSNCKLKSLNLTRNNSVTDEGVKYLANALKHSNCSLERLVLSENSITDQGVKYLAQALKHSDCKLNSVVCQGSNITDQGVKYLAKALDRSNCKLTSYEFSLSMDNSPTSCAVQSGLFDS